MDGQAPQTEPRHHQAADDFGDAKRAAARALLRYDVPQARPVATEAGNIPVTRGVEAYERERQAAFDAPVQDRTIGEGSCEVEITRRDVMGLANQFKSLGIQPNPRIVSKLSKIVMDFVEDVNLPATERIKAINSAIAIMGHNLNVESKSLDNAPKQTVRHVVFHNGAPPVKKVENERAG